MRRTESLYIYRIYNYMSTTIQISEKTLLLLKKLKEELNAASYEDAIVKVAIQKNRKSFAGSLKKYLGRKETLKNMLKEMQTERRRDERI